MYVKTFILSFKPEFINNYIQENGDINLKKIHVGKYIKY